jgi:hypothetical protein
MNIRRFKNGWLILLISFGLILSACAAAPKDVFSGILLKGSIIETSGSIVYLSIGKADGASIGQELNVYRTVPILGRRGTLTFRKEKTGMVRITDISDEQFSQAVILSGKAEKYSLVELER